MVLKKKRKEMVSGKEKEQFLVTDSKQNKE